MSRIRVTIDRVSLQGFDPAERGALLAGIRDEIRRTLSDPRIRRRLAHAQRTPVVRLGTLPLQPGINGSRAFGVRIGSSIIRATARRSKR